MKAARRGSCSRRTGLIHPHGSRLRLDSRGVALLIGKRRGRVSQGTFIPQGHPVHRGRSGRKKRHNLAVLFLEVRARVYLATLKVFADRRSSVTRYGFQLDSRAAPRREIVKARRPQCREEDLMMPFIFFFPLSTTPSVLFHLPPSLATRSWLIDEDEGQKLFAIGRTISA